MARIPDEEVLLRRVPADGARIGNITLMRALGWEDDKYWRVRDRLVDEGVLALGVGRGGSVRRVAKEPVESVPVVASPVRITPVQVQVQMQPPPPAPESDLYPPIAEVLRGKWKLDRRLKDLHVEITAQQGRRSTGGKWTRPDITALSMTKFRYVEGRYVDVWTFEIKPIGAMDVTGVLEAAAHARCATRSYVMFHAADSLSDDDETLLRCVEEARRFEVGLVVFTNPTDFATWDTRVHAVRKNPDPELMDGFIATQLSSDGRDELLRWFK
jgi:hypothetical protein